MNKTLNASFKGGLMIPLSQVLYKNQVNFRSFLYKVCKEFYTMVPVSIFFPRNSYLVENFSNKLIAFEAAGLIQHWASAHMDMKYLNFNADNVGPKKLTLSHLSGTNQMLIGGLVLAFVSFIFEMFWFKLRTVSVVKWFQARQRSRAYLD